LTRGYKGLRACGIFEMAEMGDKANANLAKPFQGKKPKKA